jgi:drug/metabolite transporter (DMT)-like permease
VEGSTFINPLFFALFANISFSLASVYFGIYSRNLGALWMNTVKALLSLIFFFITAVFLGELGQIQWSKGDVLFFLSGLIGLGLGDIFLLKGFAAIGAAKAIILFSFQPIVFLLIEYFSDGHAIDEKHLLSVSLFLVCIYIFAMEKNQGRRQWGGVIFALVGVLLDGVGLILTKQGFEFTGYSSVLANTIRNFGAILFLSIVCLMSRVSVWKVFFRFDRREQFKLGSLCLLGTYISLLFYLGALKYLPLSTVTAISVTGPLFATLFECIVEKKYPTRSLWFCLGIFLLAFGIKLYG